MAEKKEYKVLEHLTFQTDIKKLKLNADRDESFHSGYKKLPAEWDLDYKHPHFLGVSVDYISILSQSTMWVLTNQYHSF